MPEISQIAFSNKELLEILVRQAQIQEGRWVLSVNFGFNAMNVGPSPDQLTPGAIVQVLGISLQRAAADVPEAITIDASTVDRPVRASKPKRIK